MYVFCMLYVYVCMYFVFFNHLIDYTGFACNFVVSNLHLNSLIFNKSFKLSSVQLNQQIFNINGTYKYVCFLL